MTSPLLDLRDVQEIVRAGVLAPSGDNCQPWRFVWDGQRLAIHFLPERADSLYDVNDMASWISLGATLENMRVAARQRGVRLDARLFPSGGRANPVAVVHCERREGESEALLTALEARCVNRRPYRADPLPAQVREELFALARTDPRASLAFVEDRAHIRALAALAAQNDRILFENRLLHAGLYRWLRWTPEELARSSDGMPIASLELSRLEQPGFRALSCWPLARIMSAGGMTRLLPFRAQHIYSRSAAIGLLSVTGDQPADLVRGGELLERLWLTATLRGLAFQPITGMTFLMLRCRLAHGQGLSIAHQRLVEATQRILAQCFPDLERQTPVMLFRLGYAPPPTSRAPRQPVGAVLTIQSS